LHSLDGEMAEKHLKWKGLHFKGLFLNLEWKIKVDIFSFFLHLPLRTEDLWSDLTSLYCNMHSRGPSSTMRNSDANHPDIFLFMWLLTMLMISTMVEFQISYYLFNRGWWPVSALPCLVLSLSKLKSTQQWLFKPR